MIGLSNSIFDICNIRNWFADIKNWRYYFQPIFDISNYLCLDIRNWISDITKRIADIIKWISDMKNLIRDMRNWIEISRFPLLLLISLIHLLISANRFLRNQFFKSPINVVTSVILLFVAITKWIGDIKMNWITDICNYLSFSRRWLKK